MGGLKAALKDAKALMGSERWEEALQSLQTFLDEGVRDYMLYSYTGLIYSKTDQSSEAKRYYNEAISTDPSLPVAWQGLYKLYDTGKLVSDELGLTVCNKIFSLSDSIEKKERAIEIKRNILLDIGKFEELLQDFGKSAELCEKILRKFQSKPVLSTTENEMVKRAFAIVASSISEQADLHQFYCSFLYKSNADWKPQLVSLFEHADGTFAFNSWVYERLLEQLCVDYFVSGTFSWPVAKLSYCDGSNFDKSSALLTFLTNLGSNDTNSALRCIENISVQIANRYPVSLVCCRVYDSLENWEKIIELLPTITEPQLSNQLIWMKIRAHIECDQLDKALKFYQEKRPVFDVDFMFEVAKLQHIASQDLLWKSNVPESKLDILKVLEYFLCQNFAALKDCMPRISYDENSWKELLIVADCRLSIGMDVTSLLVKAAKLNARSSRAFFLLGKALLSKNPAKSKSCLERAVRMRPGNGEYILEFDDLLVQLKTEAKDRLTYLKQFANFSKPIWLRKKLARIAIEMGDRNAAIDELQHILRIEPEDISIWALLADSYFARGNLQAAMNAYQQVLVLDPSSEYAISLIQVLCRLSKDEEALACCLKFKDGRDSSDPIMIAISILEAQVVYRLVRESRGDDRISKVNQALCIIADVVGKKPRVSLLYKVAGDILLTVAEYNNDTISSLKLPASWNILTKSGVLKQASTFYSIALELNKDNVFAWNDLSCVLLRRALEDDDKDIAKKAMACIKKAISLGPSGNIRSSLWSRLAEAIRLSGGSCAHQAHCLVRSLQLNKVNDESWQRLAILYFSVGLANEAQLCFEQAIKSNPHSSSAWSGYAAKAESCAHSIDAMDMYRHSLSVSPLPLAVEKYTAYLCTSLRKNVEFDPSTVMIDFEKVLDLRNKNSSTRLLLHIAVLAELFGFYDESVAILERLNENDVQPHLDRSIGKSGSNCSKNRVLSKLASMELKELFRLLIANNETYNNLFAALQNEDDEAFSLLIKEKRKSVSIPLVVSAVITLNLNLSDAAVSALHDLLPRHELIDVFPTILPDGMDTELKYLQQDGEDPFRYRHHISKPLFEELQKLRVAQK